MTIPKFSEEHIWLFLSLSLFFSPLFVHSLFCSNLRLTLVAGLHLVCFIFFLSQILGSKVNVLQQILYIADI